MSQWEDVTDSAGEEPSWAVTQPGQDQTESGPTGWGPVGHDDHAPFGGVEQVDGLVYTEEDMSPELQWTQAEVDVPLPPVRERPRPLRPERAEPWKPGPDPKPAQQRGDNRAVKLLLLMMVPLLIFAALGWLVYRVMLAYGLTG